MTSARTHLERLLADVEHELRTLERAARSSERLGPTVSAAHEATIRRLSDERARLLEQLDRQLPLSAAEPATTGLWQPLALHSRDHAARPTLEASAHASARTPHAALDAARRLARLYCRRKNKPKQLHAAIAGARRAWERDPTQRALSFAVSAAMRDFAVAPSTPPDLELPVDPECEPAAPLPDPGELPSLEDGLTRTQRLALQVYFRAAHPNDRIDRLSVIAQALEVQVESLQSALFPLTHEGGARYPLVELRHTHQDTRLRLTAFGDEVLPPGPDGTVQPRIPLLLCLGSGGPCATPPHNLSDVVAALAGLVETPAEARALTPDLTHGGLIEADDELRRFYRTGEGTLSLRAELTIEAWLPAATIVIGALPPGCTPESFDAGVAEVFRALELRHSALTREGTGWVLQLEHLAFVDFTLRALRLRGATHHRERLHLRVLVDGTVNTMTPAQVLRDFFLRQAARGATAPTEESRELQTRLHRARGLAAAAVMHQLVDEVIASADDNDEAVSALTRLQHDDWLTHPAFKGRVTRAAVVDALQRLALTEPDFADFDAFSLEQAKSLLRERRLGARRDLLLKEWRTLRDAMRERTPDQRTSVEAFTASLADLAIRHGGQRRARQVPSLERSWPWTSLEVFAPKSRR